MRDLPNGRGWIISRNNVTCTKNVLFVHGFANSRLEFAPIVFDALESCPYCCLMFMDLLHSGEREHSWTGVTFGQREARDIEQFIQLYHHLGPQKLTIVGASAGAAATIIALNSTFVQKSVCHAVLFFPFLSAPKVLIDRFSLNGVLEQIILMFHSLWLNQHSILEPDSGIWMTPQQVIENWPKHDTKSIPLVFLHGGKDGLVPASHSLKLGQIYEKHWKAIRRGPGAYYRYIERCFVEKGTHSWQHLMETPRCRQFVELACKAT